MKKIILFLCYSILIVTLACNKKKLTEVVEVPLPSENEKYSIGSPNDVRADEGSFELYKLPFQYDAVSPEIKAYSMELHYSKHYLAYVNSLNKAVKNTDYKNLTIEEVLSKSVSDSLNLRNNAGGCFNHRLFFECIGPKKGELPRDTLKTAIVKNFGSFEGFKNQFIKTANSQFGSGWAWLIVDKSGKLQVATTPNQDNPLMPNALISGTPILALDLWEHAYYLEYQNKRKNYIDAFFNIINWKIVEDKYEETLRKIPTLE